MNKLAGVNGMYCRDREVHRVPDPVVFLAIDDRKTRSRSTAIIITV